MAGPTPRTGSRRKTQHKQGTTNSPSPIFEAQSQNHWRQCSGQPGFPCPFRWGSLACRVPAEIAASDIWGRIWGRILGQNFWALVSVSQTRTDFFPLRIPLFLRDVPGPCSSDSLADKKWETLTVLSMAVCELLWSPSPDLTIARTRPGKTLDRVSPTQTRLMDYEKITAQDLPWYLRLAETRSSLLLQPWPSRSKPKQKNKMEDICHSAC